MTTLYEAITTNTGRTWNGGRTQTTSLSKCVDLFFNAGSMRGKDILPMFRQALAEDEDRALRIAQWLRDVRGGAGERQLYRDILKYLEEIDHPKLNSLIHKTPEIGRWDDILIFEVNKYKTVAYSEIEYALFLDIALCAKWMPRKGPIANELRKFLAVSPKEYREELVRLTNVVEQDMCAKDWDNIEFDKIPSLASARYQNAFGRNCSHYSNYIDSLEKGETKINAAAVYPYDITKSIDNGNVRVANEQWKALPNYLQNTEERILPMVDVSGSMFSRGWGSKGPAPIEVAVSLGLYLSERLTGSFKDTFLTFSATPQLWRLTGTLEQRYNSLTNAIWGFNTNIQKTFETVLINARHANVPQEEMPTTIIILSDMEFDVCTTPADRNTKSYDMMREQYERCGYKLPKIVFWNLNGREGNVPVSYNEVGTALVSGFSPSIMKAVLSGEDFSPEVVMDRAIMIDRYKL